MQTAKQLAPPKPNFQPNISAAVPDDAPKNRCRPELAERHHSGFWARLPFLPDAALEGKFKKVYWPDLGLTVTYCVSRNRLYDSDVAYRYFDAVVRDNTTDAPVAVAQFSLLQNFGLPYDNESYFDILDEHSACAGEFGDLLSNTCKSLAQVFRIGRTIANFGHFEMMPGSRWKGKGLEIGARLMLLLWSRYRAAAFVYKAHPLQYRIKDVECSQDESRQAWANFDKDKATLTSMYVKAWGARPIADAEYLVSSPCFKIRVEKKSGKWSLD